MKKEELIVGEYYLGSYEHDYIMIYDGKEECYSHFIEIKQRRYNNNGSFRIKGSFSKFKYKRLATQEEKNWLDACIQAEKFIPLDEVNQSINYEIY